MHKPEDFSRLLTLLEGFDGVNKAELQFSEWEIAVRLDKDANKEQVSEELKQVLGPVSTGNFQARDAGDHFLFQGKCEPVILTQAILEDMGAFE